MSHPAFTAQEKKILAVLAAVQFVNIMDFMMVMPLGPDLGRALGIELNHLGWIGGSYTFAAFCAGLLGTLYLDRLPRRQALLGHLTGLALATLAGALAVDLWTLLAARVAAGLFGGPATSTLLAIISDVIKPERRGRALGLVMAAFSVASIAGVPAGLELARLGGWKLPFIAVGALAALTVVAGYFLLPDVEGHRREAAARHAQSGGDSGAERLLSDGAVPISLFIIANATLAIFLLIPNMSGFLQFNVGFPRERLGVLYFAGGILSLFSTRLGGIWNDRVGSTIPIATATLLFAAVLGTGMLVDSPLVPIVPWFAFLMFANSLRWISVNTLTSKVPSARHRGKYMSLSSATQHLASSLGAFLSTQLLTTSPEGRLEGVHRLALVSLGLSLTVPPLSLLVERMIRRRRHSDRALAPAAPLPPTEG